MGKYWSTVLYPYMKTGNIVWCPSDPWKQYQRNNPNAWVSYYWKAAVDLAWFGGTGRYPSGPKCRRDVDFAFPSHQFILFERVPFHDSGGYAPVQNGSQINCLFMDNHVAAKIVKDCAIPSNASMWYSSTQYSGEPFFFNSDGQHSNSGKNWDPRIWRDDL